MRKLLKTVILARKDFIAHLGLQLLLNALKDHTVLLGLVYQNLAEKALTATHQALLTLMNVLNVILDTIVMVRE